jgi:hypothetical protein
MIGKGNKEGQTGTLMTHAQIVAVAVEISVQSRHRIKACVT